MGDGALDHVLTLHVHLLPVRGGLVVRFLIGNDDQTGKLGRPTDLLLAEQAVLCKVTLQT